MSNIDKDIEILEKIIEPNYIDEWGLNNLSARTEEAISNVLNELKEANKQLDLDYIKDNYISKDVVRKKIDNYKEKIKLNEREIKKNPDPINSKITHSFDEYYQWKNKVMKENELLKSKIEVLKELLKE